jgi:sugar phosphate isomerase/epimerase
MNRRELLRTLPALAGAAQLGAEGVHRGLLHTPQVLAAAAQLNSKSAKCHLRAGLVAYSFRKALQAKTLSYEDLIRYVADQGLDGLDTTVYWFPDTSDQYLAKLRSVAYKCGVQLYSAAARVRLSQPTPELRAAEVDNAKKWIDVADKLGAAHVRVFGGALPKGATEAQAIGWAVEVLKRAAEYAGTKGIVLGVEDDGGITATAEPTVQIVKQADTPWAGINLDTGNFPKNGYAQVELCLPYAVAVHLKTKIAPPEGPKEKADWDRLAGMFCKAGYKGYLSLEYEDNDDPMQAVPALAAELRRVVRKYS